MAGRIGWTRCGCCGQPEAAVSETDKGTLSITCHKCQFSGFAKAGTKAKRLTLAELIPEADEDASPPKGTAQAGPAPAPQEPPKTPPAAKPAGLLIG